METTVAAAAPAPPPYREGLPPQPPGPPEGEQHPAGSETLRDLAAGAADGPTLPFALAAALAGVGIAANPVIVTAGLAAVAAASLAAGLGRYLAARGEALHYQRERRREEQETQDWPEREKWEVSALLHRYGLRGETLARATEAVASDRRRWVDFMMRFELELKEPAVDRAARGAAATGLARALAGVVPLLPFMVQAEARPALLLSAAATGAALLGFGGLKAAAAGQPRLAGALRALGIGAGAALAALLVAVLVGA
jgi:VIT1/CCC1 family predicted Fe2+/Mn2+ transporter